MALEKRSSSGSGRFKYKERSQESMEKRTKKVSDFDGILREDIQAWRPEVGENVIRYLPPTWEDPEHYGYDVWVHDFVGSKKGSYLCLAKMKDKRCPICEVEAEYRAEGDKDTADKIAPRRKVVAYMLDREDRKMRNIPQVHIMGRRFDRDIMRLCQDRKRGAFLYIDNPDIGNDVRFEREGSKLNTRYTSFVIERPSTPLAESQKEVNKVMQFIQENPIPDVLEYKKAAYLEEIMAGGANTDEDDDEDEKPKKKKRPAVDDDEDEKPVKRRRSSDDDDDEDEAPKKRKRPADDDEDEDEAPAKKRKRADPDDDEDEDEDERPAKKKAPAKKKPAKDDEDDEDEDDEDDEDEKPVKKKAPAKKKPAKDEDDDEDDEDEDDEDEKPVKKKAPAKKKPAKDEDDDEDDEDEDDEDEDDEDEDERPAKKRRK